MIIETYLSCLGERLLDSEIPSKKFNNITKEEKEAFYSLKDDPSITIKGADKCTIVAIIFYHSLRKSNRTLRMPTIF